MQVNYFLLVWIAASLWPLSCTANKEESVDAGSQYSQYRRQMITIVIVFIVIFCCLALVTFLTGLCCSNCSKTTRTISDQETGLMVTCTAPIYIVQYYIIQEISVQEDSKRIERSETEIVPLL